MELTKTRRQLIDQVLDNLGVLVVGEAPSDDDISKVDAVIDPTIARINTEEIAYIADPGQPVAAGGEIDAAQFLSIVAIVADAAKAGWGLAGDPSYYVLAQQAEETLRRLARPPSSRSFLTTDPILRRGLRIAGRVW